MKKIFEPVELGAGLKLKNRLVRSATLEKGADADGRMTPLFREVYSELARGGVGLIITGMMGVDERSCLTPSMVRIGRPDFLKEFQKLADVVHGEDCRVVVQLGHCGQKAMTPPDGSAILSPSGLRDETSGAALAPAAAREDLRMAAAAFGEAALRCKEAGADGVQIHGAHGYLISQFLSPYYNRRTDEYGGSLENRSQLLFEVYDAVRGKVGRDFHVMIKINYEDWTEPGFDGQECLWVCGELARRGIDAIEVSAGLSISPQTKPSQVLHGQAEENYNQYRALSVAEAVDVPVISVGGYRRPEAVEEVLNAGKIQAVAMCRPLICEPDLPRRWADKQAAAARCVSCNGCFERNGFGCILNQ